jgi:hypothetical protein
VIFYLDIFSSFVFSRIQDRSGFVMGRSLTIGNEHYGWQCRS